MTGKRRGFMLLLRVHLAALGCLIAFLHGAAPAACAQMAASGPLLAGAVATGPLPAYPAPARRAHKKGVVVLKVAVTPQGHVASAAVASGTEPFASAVVAAVRTWTFTSDPAAPATAPYSGVLVFRFDADEDRAHGMVIGGPSGSKHHARPCDGTGAVRGVPGGIPGGEPGGIASAQAGGAPAPTPPTRSDPAAKQPTPSEPASGSAVAGKAVYRAQPLYPHMASAAGVAAAVVVEVTVDELGMVACARVISGHPLLNDAALAAARQWVFTPTELEGQPVRVIGTLTFNFRRQ